MGMGMEATVYTKTSAVRTSSLLLALLFGVTVVGLPVAVWLVAVARGSVSLDADGIRVTPGRGSMPWAAVRRFGIGRKSGALDPDSASPMRFTTVHLLLQDETGRTLAVHLHNYRRAPELFERIQDQVARPPEPLLVSFLLQRLSFRER